MPFTPFHLGPGMLFKAAGGSHFSFLIFAGSQVLMDIEPLVRIIRQDSVLHGPSHTIAGALVIGITSAVIGRPISERALRLTGKRHPISLRVAFLSAFTGTYSHIVLDGIMHADMKPFWPIGTGNGLLGLVSLHWLHQACLVCGAAGLAIIAAKAIFKAILSKE